jgi:hypothetical protein
MITRLARTLLHSAVLALGAVVALAGSASADPPGRVGRLSFVEGEVSHHGPGEDAWSPATLNYPVTTGDAFWTPPGARAEIRFGSSSVHLDGGTDLEVYRLDD